MLHEGGGAIKSLAVRAHLVVCRRCRAEACSVRVVREAVEEFGRYEPPADLLPAILAVPKESAPLQVPVKEERGMRRIVFASIAIVAVLIGGAIVIPGRWKKPDPRSILVGVVEAMENAKSIHVVGRGTRPATDTPSGMRMMPGSMDIWLTTRAAYVRGLAPDGTLEVATALSVDDLKWWAYEGGKRTLHVADLAPIAARATKAVSSLHEMWLSAFLARQFKEIVAEKFPDAKQEVAIETRGGRKVAIVTVTFTVKTSPRRVTERCVFEVDAETKHVLTMRQYARAEGAAEELVGALDKVDYDAPLPDVSSALRVPEGTKTVQATATIEESKSLLSLIMKAGGEEVGRMDTIQPEQQ
jgi:hypothetical protein